MTAILGTVLVLPAFPLRGHYVSIATLAIGEIVALVILNWEGLTRGPIGVFGIPPLSILGIDLADARSVYWFSLGILVVLALLQLRLLGTHLGRTFARRARRRRGGALLRYPSGALQDAGLRLRRLLRRHQRRPHVASLLVHQPRDLQQPAFDAGPDHRHPRRHGQCLGRHRGIGAPDRLPEVFRVAAEYRVLIYGIVLLLLVRFRPQGLLGTV